MSQQHSHAEQSGAARRDRRGCPGAAVGGAHSDRPRNHGAGQAALGKPISPFDYHKADYHIAGSDAAGIVWKVGAKIKATAHRVKIAFVGTLP